MKKVISTGITAMIAAIVFLSCSKTGNTIKKNPTTTAPYNMSATISGVSFSRDSCLFVRYDPLDTVNKAEIIGWAGSQRTLSNYYPYVNIFFHPYKGLGSYTFSGTSGTAEGYLTTDSTDEVALSGSLTITSEYPTVVGTFNFTTKMGHIVSNGSFTALRK